ncbi:MAG: carbohydrate-binding domain-containing protein, partial [Bacteroidota bacterium]
TVEGGNGTGTYASGASVNISAAAPPAGHIFQEWVGNSIYVDDYYVADPTSPNTSVTIPSGNIQLKATYKKIPPPRYDLTVNNGLGTGSYEAGDEVLVIANNPNPGLQFTGWTGATNNITYPASGASKAAVRIVMPAQSITMTANYTGGQQPYLPCGDVLNTGFEEGFFAWDSGNATLSDDTHTGDWAALGLGGPAFSKIGYDATGHTSVELKAWVKALGNTNGSSFGIDFVDGGGNVMQDEKVVISVNSTDGWEELSESKAIPPNTATINVWTWVNQGQILYDDVCLIFDGGTPPTNYTLSLNAPNGSISLNPSGGVYPAGTVVTLTASADAGYSFDNWSGDLSGSNNPIQITMDGNKNVTANFTTAPNNYTLDVTALNGSVSLSPAGGTYASGTTVTLTAQPDAGFNFASWAGDLSGSSNPTTIVMDGNKAVTANFTPDGGSGGGDISIRARGNAGEETMELRLDDVTVATWTLTTALDDFVYSGYSGNQNIKVAHVNDGLNSQGVDKNLFVDYIIVDGTTYQTETSATREGCGDPQWIWCNGYFDFGNIEGGGNPNYTLDISAINGSVSLSPAGGSYPAGTVVTLTATADAGFNFTDWSGDANGSSNPITIVMDGDKSVTANFSAIPTYTLGITANNGTISLSPSGGIYQAGTVV